MESFQILDFEALRSPEGTLLSLFRRGITHMGRKSGFNRGCKHSRTGKVHGWKLDVIFLFIMAYALLTTSQVSHPLELGSLFWVSKMPFGECWRIVTLVTLFMVKVLYNFHHLLSHSHSSDAAFCTYAVIGLPVVLHKTPLTKWTGCFEITEAWIPCEFQFGKLCFENIFWHGLNSICHRL